MVALGGGGVMVSIALIFLYLLWVIAPVFAPASIEPAERFDADLAQALILDVSENSEIAFALDASGRYRFWDLSNGADVHSGSVGRPLRGALRMSPRSGNYAVIDADGSVLLLDADYPVSFTNDTRRIDARLRPRFTAEWLALELGEQPIVHRTENRLLLASLSGRELQLWIFDDPEPGFALLKPRRESLELERNYDLSLMGPRGRLLYLLRKDGLLETVSISRSGRLSSLGTQRLLEPDRTLLSAATLVGGYSLLIADNQQTVEQWFATGAGPRLERIRGFELPGDIRHIIPEPRRKGFVTVDEAGTLTLLHSTTTRALTSAKLGLPLTTDPLFALSPRADVFLATTESDTVQAFRVANEHPEVSLGALFERVWYEGYSEPVHSWQSSGADNDFEPKFSLTPLLFGTLKAAFYAMLFAMPVAVLGALYTAYAMAPAMRSFVKPTVEIMAALPTVILGFLAGLWLAPIVEANLSGILAALILLPLVIVLISAFVTQLPSAYRARLQGWYGLLMVPVVILTISAALTLGVPLEEGLFAGDLPEWLDAHLGLPYDQRNALVVGVAMGFAVIPTVFAIAEDAIHGVPRHLVNGSLALGATRWQTLSRVVMVTASPGIFSALMIGTGRAVGETMIVLMATGNTPIMDMNLFEGMRTFAANIAIELPETEVGGSHYRILFLAALVLFLLTFLFNTVAELVRQRLRERYGAL